MIKYHKLQYEKDKNDHAKKLGYKNHFDAIIKMNKSGKDNAEIDNAEIGRILNVSTTSIRFTLSKMGLKSCRGQGGDPYKKLRKEKREYITKKFNVLNMKEFFDKYYFNGNMTLKEISKECNSSTTYIKNEIIRLGKKPIKK